MKTIYLCNAFSLSMLGGPGVLIVKEADDKIAAVDTVKELLAANGFISAIGHDATAQFVSELFGVKVNPNRIQVKIGDNDLVVVVQLLQRLPKGVVLDADAMSKIPYEIYTVGKLQ